MPVRGCQWPLRKLGVWVVLCSQSLTRPWCSSRAVGESQFRQYRACRTGRTMACKRSGVQIPSAPLHGMPGYQGVLRLRRVPARPADLTIVSTLSATRLISATARAPALGRMREKRRALPGPEPDRRGHYHRARGDRGRARARLLQPRQTVPPGVGPGKPGPTPLLLVLLGHEGEPE
jgi:hypothetical protein